MISMNNKGQVGVIVAILIISLLVAVLVIIQTYYVPQWMKEREAEHMDVVANQFASLKYSIDLQATQKSHSPLVNSITLGSKELPYFISSRAFGSLQILSPSESNFGVFVGGEGRNLQKFYEKIQHGEVDFINSFDVFAIWINDLEAGDGYNALSPYFNITLKASGSNSIAIHLTIKNGSGDIIFDDTISNGRTGDVELINLMDKIYNFSSLIKYINFPINVTINCSQNGSFVIKGYRYGSVETINFPPLYLAKMGEIKYSSQNAYFVNQNYIYEGSGVILNQRMGSSIIHPPLITIKNGSLPYINMTWVNVIGVEGKTGVTGYGTYSIRINYLTTYHYSAIGNLSITLYSSYSEAWFKYFNITLNESGIKYSIEKGDGYIKVGFSNVKIDMDVANVRAQIGPGWVA